MVKKKTAVLESKDDPPLLPELQIPKKEKNILPKELQGKIMVKKSPVFKDWKGTPLQKVSHLKPDEIVAVDPNDKKVRVMLKNGNLQFVSNKIRKSPTGKYPRILED